MIVLDASAALELLLDTEPGLAVARSLAAGGSAHVPHLFDVEVMSVVRRYERAGEVSPAKAEQALSDLLQLPVARCPHGPLLPRAWELRNSVAPYDAVYVALAELLGAPLLTRDARLARSHGHRARIELVQGASGSS